MCRVYPEDASHMKAKGINGACGKEGRERGNRGSCQVELLKWGPPPGCWDGSTLPNCSHANPLGTRYGHQIR